MPKVFTSKNQKTGELGEYIACIYLKNKGFTIIEQNYYKLIGEIDIIAKKDSILHFIEVKSVSHQPDEFILAGETGGPIPAIRAEENFTREKSYKFKKIITLYMADKRVSHETMIEIDLLCVYIDRDTLKATIKPFWNIIL